MKTDENYMMLYLYCTNYQDWRKFVQEYYNVTAKEAKIIITKIFYGGGVPDDVPFMVKLKNEIDEAVFSLLAHPKY